MTKILQLLRLQGKFLVTELSDVNNTWQKFLDSNLHFLQFLNGFSRMASVFLFIFITDVVTLFFL